ncbi:MULTISPECIES: hypothetical protein [unclassified Tenacibaculum]|uniref:hypothetical protein n=1 Tax=unclassified Tenacibaculum TaxID=2635139 RepID=UPI001F26919D|nr:MULTISPECIES: hypothetical protein [unclassified Tenacibaculum]MCF2873880.1 hypothetical protein [Tenacibaculum sp. Cn5-1]MCF2936690.1 hypothetical protein [Tenacibaculum sp. Cn5-34]MCG7512914.1 hypothetical protein [Tenacibaculum sp. Cn5-46]
MEKKDGKYLEQLVELIEKSIDSDAIIERDVQMPLLNSLGGYKTQCDIVITKGVAPRITKTIIEVQDRNSKVKPNDFRGWIQKLEEVGAQHLICVSKQEFPESIKEKARYSGNKVSLINLSSLDTERIPINFFNYNFYYSTFHLKQWNLIKINNLSNSNTLNLKSLFSNRKISANDKVFSYDKNIFFSFNELANISIKDKNIFNQKVNSTFSSFFDKNRSLYLFYSDTFIEINCEFNFSYVLLNENIPTSLMSYEQDEFGALAWIIKAVYRKDKRFVEMNIPVTKRGDKYILKKMLLKYSDNQLLSFETKVSKNNC